MRGRPLILAAARMRTIEFSGPARRVSFNSSTRRTPASRSAPFAVDANDYIRIIGHARMQIEKIDIDKAQRGSANPANVRFCYYNYYYLLSSSNKQ